jgi:putative methyltransferase (TIGR04325 family)
MMQIANKEFIKMFIPPVFMQAYRSLRENLNLSGNYQTWDEAMRDSTGYDAEIILEKTKAALLKVKQGDAIYERDSVLFDEIIYAWPLLAGLMWITAKSGGKLHVLDFGGSLGVTYFQNRVFLDSLREVRWNIVEQTNHVQVGKEFFEDDILRFFSNIKDCIAENHPNVVILSGVLQYLERPYDVLCELMELNCEHVIIDRTPFCNSNKERLCVQHVPPSIYPASFPSWIFSMPLFLSVISKHGYKLITEFESQDKLTGPIDFTCKGLILQFH